MKICDTCGYSKPLTDYESELGYKYTTCKDCMQIEADKEMEHFNYEYERSKL